MEPKNKHPKSATQKAIAILGSGGCGAIFSELIQQHSYMGKVTAVAEPREASREPMASSIGDCRAIEAAQRHTGRFVAVFHSLRYRKGGPQGERTDCRRSYRVTSHHGSGNLLAAPYTWLRAHETMGNLRSNQHAIMIKTYADDNVSRIDLGEEGGGHGGCDARVLREWLMALVSRDDSQLVPNAHESLKKPSIVFAAERSRREGLMVEVKAL